MELKQVLEELNLAIPMRAAKALPISSGGQATEKEIWTDLEGIQKYRMTLWPKTGSRMCREGSSNPDVIKIPSLLDLNYKLEAYYKRGYVVATIHPTILSVGQRKRSPLSYIYRVILTKIRSSIKKSEQGEPRHSKLVVEEWSVSNQTLSIDVVKGLLDKVNDLTKKGMKFVGFLNPLSTQSKACNGTKLSRELVADLGQDVDFKLPDQRKQNPDNHIKCSEEIFNKKPMEFAMEKEHSCNKVTDVLENGPAPEKDLLHGREKRIGNETCPCSQPKEDFKLFAVFNVSDEDFSERSYHEGNVSLRVARKGQTICTLEADWLEITTSYYKSGMSLVDSFVVWETMKDLLKGSLEATKSFRLCSQKKNFGQCNSMSSQTHQLNAKWRECWGTPTGSSQHHGGHWLRDYLSKSVDGMFIYEEHHLRSFESSKIPNDAIVVEQWTVIEGCEVKTDYGPLLHTLAEFGWLVTCVLATPIIRHDSEGNLATKQVIFLQRPAITYNDLHLETLEKRSTRQTKVSERTKNWNRNVGVTTGKNKHSETKSPEDSCTTSGTNSHQYGDISGMSRTDSVFKDLDDGQLDQEEETPQVTCI
ncbi:raftlin-2 isoform X2 [Chiloscyllium punctatum]|uniref:raftlin-2 isoform X2 n=1 Tax=Chiloscyllium punctatum TaxID=137246 RepID=UPI003B638A26